MQPCSARCPLNLLKSECDSLRDQVATLRRENDVLRQQRDALSLACTETDNSSKAFKIEVVDLHYLLAMSMVKERENDARAVLASLKQAGSGVHTAALSTAEQIWLEFCAELEQSRTALKSLRADCRSQLDQEDFTAASVKSQFHKLVPRSPRKPDLEALRIEAAAVAKLQKQQMPPPPQPPPHPQQPSQMSQAAASVPAARPRSIKVSLPCNSLPGPVGSRTPAAASGTASPTPTAAVHVDTPDQHRGAIKYMPIVQKILPHVTLEQVSQALASISARPGTQIEQQLINILIDQHQARQQQQQLRQKQQQNSTTTNGGGRAYKLNGAGPPNAYPSATDGVDLCAVCQDSMDGQQEPVRQLDCRHLFHDACIRRWLQECSVCPTCRNYSLLPDEYPKLW